MRHKIIRLLSTALVLMGSVVAQVEAAPILWDSGTGSNGNAYEYIAGTITWSAAKAAAEGMTFNGRLAAWLHSTLMRRQASLTHSTRATLTLQYLVLG